MPKVFDVSKNEKQRDFILSNARFVLYAGGVGSGKTAAGAVKAINKINSGESGIIVAPDNPQFFRSTWPEFSKWLPWSRCKNRHLEHPYTNRKELVFDIRGRDVTVYYGGIENETGWAGPNVNWAWFDEAARKRTRTAFNVLSARVRVGNNPQLWITTTPSGVSHWLYDVFVKGIFPDDIVQQLKDDGFKGKIVEYFKASTEANKDNLDQFYYLTLKGMYTGKLRQQELDGEFVTMNGLVWEDFGPNNISEEADYHSGVPVEWWVDDGFTKGHPRVILMAQVIPPYVNVFDCYHAEYELAEDSINKALGMSYPKPDIAFVDSSAAELRSRLWQKDIDTIKASHDVEEGIKRTASWITGGHLRFHPRCQWAINDISGYVRDDVTGKPIKDSDHAGDCIRYGLWTKDREEILGEEDTSAPLSLGELFEPVSEIAELGFDELSDLRNDGDLERYGGLLDYLLH